MSGLQVFAENVSIVDGSPVRTIGIMFPNHVHNCRSSERYWTASENLGDEHSFAADIGRWFLVASSSPLNAQRLKLAFRVGFARKTQHQGISGAMSAYVGVMGRAITAGGYCKYPATGSLSGFQ